MILDYRKKGFTLIEILITISLLALIILVAAPFSGSWVGDARVLETEGQLTQAMGKAKAAALRNRMGAINNNPVAIICKNNTNLVTVVEGISGTAPNCSPLAGSQIWETQIHSTVTINVNNAAMSCLCLDNKGAVTTATAACSACSTATQFSLGSGSISSTVAIY
jgi:type IV pilus assembly protein PilA